VSSDPRVQHESVYRAANESIQRSRYSPADALLGFLCECSDLDCATDLELTLGEYRTVRLGDRHFAVAAGHEQVAIESVVDEFDRYTVVAKRAGA